MSRIFIHEYLCMKYILSYCYFWSNRFIRPIPYSIYNIEKSIIDHLFQTL